MIVLDTQAWLWLAADEQKLSKKAASAISRADRSSGLGLPAIAVWEAVWLHRRRRLSTTLPLRDWLARLFGLTSVQVLPLTPEICALAAELPSTMSSDPCDRLIAATALHHGSPLVTADEKIRASGCVQTIW